MNPPLALFRKFIQFGCGTLHLQVKVLMLLINQDISNLYVLLRFKLKSYNLALVLIGICYTLENARNLSILKQNMELTQPLLITSGHSWEASLMHLESFTEHNLAAVMSCLVIRRGEKNFQRVTQLYTHQIFPVISGSLYYK